MTPWFTKMKKILISCINDENIVSPLANVHPNANAKNIMEKGMKYLEDILSKSFTFFTMLITGISFCFMKFNTITSIIVVPQVLLEYFMLMDKVNKVGRPQVEQSSVRSVRLPVRIWNKVYGASKDFRSVNEYFLSLVENDLIKKKVLKKSERRSPVTSTKRSQ